jgi:hypothetical protein
MVYKGDFKFHSNFRFGKMGTRIGQIKRIYTDFFLPKRRIIKENPRKSVKFVQSVFP